MKYRIKQISCRPWTLSYLSVRLIESHYENNYGGAVRRLNAITEQLESLDYATTPGHVLNGLKREELVALNSTLLHELYFASLGGDGQPTQAMSEALAGDFGSIDRWRAEFTALGYALGGGSGWVLLTRSPRDGTLSNVWAADHTHGMAGGTPILALDMYEHAYHLEFGANAGAYVDAFMANIAWPRVAARWAGIAAENKPHTVATPAAQQMLADPNLIVIDARLAEDATTVPVRLRGARRAPPDKIEEVAASLSPGSKVLVYCAWGFEIGGNCAAKFRERGIDAVALAGGIGTWRADGLPTEPHNEGDKT